MCNTYYGSNISNNMYCNLHDNNEIRRGAKDEFCQLTKQ